MRDRVGLDSMGRVALLVVRREFSFDVREGIEMPRAGAFELAPQFMIADRCGARLEKIAGFRKFSHPGCRASIYQRNLTYQAHHCFARRLGRGMLGRLRKKTLVVVERGL